jgi:hypothetical protein
VNSSSANDHPMSLRRGAMETGLQGPCRERTSQVRAEKNLDPPGGTPTVPPPPRFGRWDPQTPMNSNPLERSKSFWSLVKGWTPSVLPALEVLGSRPLRLRSRSRARRSRPVWPMYASAWWPMARTPYTPGPAGSALNEAASKDTQGDHWSGTMRQSHHAQAACQR